jgi:hypothetical protein
MFFPKGETIMNDHELMASRFHLASLPDYGVELKIHRMDYPFLIHRVFGNRREEKEETSDFGLHFDWLAKEYMKSWILADPKENKTSENFDCFYSFSSRIDPNIYSRIADGKTWDDAYIAVSNAVLRLRRFGNGLGIRILSNNNRQEVHRDGTAILEKLCQECSHMSRFIHSIECIFPLPKKQGKENSVNIDFIALHQQLKEACLYVSWRAIDRFARELILKYTSHANPDIVIGNCHGIAIQGELVHKQGSSNQKVIQWRRGNIIGPNDDSFIYNFADGNDLCLSLSAQSGLPQNNFMSEIEINQDVSRTQHILLNVGSMLYAQLCAMEVYRRTAIVV